MAIEEAVSSVFGAFLALPEAKRYLDTGKHISADVFLHIPAVAKEVFRNEPGCVVKHKAIRAKVKVLQPHLKATVSGPTLMAFFNELRKHRNKWAVAFANHELHVAMTYQRAQDCGHMSPDLIQQRAKNGEDARMVLRACLDAAENKLSGVKSSREFARYVRILEECTKKHKIHLQRKAYAEKMRETLAMKRTQVKKAKKAKKTVLINTMQTQPFGRTGSVFNPDLPDFAQFMKSHTTDHPATAIETTNEDLQPVTCDGAKAPKTISSTKVTTKKQHRLPKVGETPAVRAPAGVNVVGAEVGAGGTTLPSHAHDFAGAGSKDMLAMATAKPSRLGFTTVLSTNANQAKATPLEIVGTSDLELEKVLRMELGIDMPEYLSTIDNVSSPLPKLTGRTMWRPEQSNVIDDVGERKYDHEELDASSNTASRPLDGSALTSADLIQQVPRESSLFGTGGFNIGHEVINGEFGGGSTLDEDPLPGADAYRWSGTDDFALSPLAYITPGEEEDFDKLLFGTK